MTRRMLWVVVLALGCGRKEEPKKEEPAKPIEAPVDPAQIAANERSAIGSLKTIAMAEAGFRSNDRDNNRMVDYWTADVAGLYAIDNTSTGATAPVAIKLIELSVALADLSPRSGTPHDNYRNPITKFGAPAAHRGYWFRALGKDLQAEMAYAQDSDATGDLVHNVRRFGFCAVPAEYGKTGKRVFIMNEGLYVMSRDFGKDVLKPGKTPPELADVFDANWPTDKDLAEKWTKVE